MAKRCKICRTEFEPRYRTTEMFCSRKCEIEYKRSRPKKDPVKIRRFSAKRAKAEGRYNRARKKYLAKPENKYCFVPGCTKKANTVEHRRGRDGYADQWARDNDITLLLDERFWAPCCWEHNTELENNPELSRALQLSKIHGGKKA